MKGYKQISYDERVKIGQMKQSGKSISRIASALGRNRSTISRELHRNQAPPGEYWPDTAQNLALKRCARDKKLDRLDPLRKFIMNQISSFGWTPEQIAGYLKDRQTDLPYVSHETIYAWIYGPSAKKYKLYKSLPRHKSRRGLRKSKGAGVSRIPNRTSIEQRPPEAATEFGHWEADLMAFSKNTQHIVVLRERQSGLVLSQRLNNKTASETYLSISKLFRNNSISPKSITFDNGGEFAKHDLLDTQTYFCDPYASWQKGGIENSNGRLRRDLPRSMDIWSLEEDDFDEVIFNHNNTPRKMLGWYTPLEVFSKNSHFVALHS